MEKRIQPSANIDAVLEQVNANKRAAEEKKRKEDALKRKDRIKNREVDIKPLGYDNLGE